MPACDNLRAPGNRLQYGGFYPRRRSGRAVLSGCHVEAITPGIVREWTGKFSSGDINDARLSQEIKRFAPGQYMVGLSAILDQLALVPHHSFLRQIVPAFLPADLRPAVA